MYVAATRSCDCVIAFALTLTKNECVSRMRESLILLKNQIFRHYFKVRMHKIQLIFWMIAANLSGFVQRARYKFSKLSTRGLRY